MDRDLLLLKHLTKLLGDEEQAIKMILDNQYNLFTPKGLAYQVGKTDFEFFCKYFLQDTFIPKENNSARNLSPSHLKVWEELQKMFIDDSWDKELFILPRGFSKTTVINKALSTWLHCYKKSIYSIVIGNKDLDAIQFVADTRKMLENQYIKEVFGTLIDSNTRVTNKQELELTNNTKIQAFGWGSSVRGTTYGSTEGTFRPTLVISDDIQDENDILSENAKEKVLNKWYKEVEEVGDTAVYRNGKKIKSATKFIVIGTPLSHDCYINQIKKDSTYKVFHRSVTNIDVDKYFNENEYWLNYKRILFNDKLDKETKETELKNYYDENKKYMEFPTIWEKYQCDELAQKYYNKRIAFLQELMCDCENIGENWIKTLRTQRKKEIENHSFVKTMLVVDPASTTTNKSDYTAFTVGSLAENDFYYVRFGEIARLGFNDYCNRVIEILEHYVDITHVCIEKNTYQGADVLKIKELIKFNEKLKNRNIEFINEMQRKNKDDKISTILDDINNGVIIFNEECEEYIKQVKDFRGQLFTLHDDAIDTVAEFRIRINSINVVTKVTFFNKRLLF